MRTDEGALVALDTLFGVPAGNAGGNAALFKGGDAIGEGAVGHVFKGGDRQAVAVHLVDGLEQGFRNLDGSGTAGQFGFGSIGSGICPAFGYINLDKSSSAHVDGVPVLINHILTLLQVGVFLRRPSCTGWHLREAAPWPVRRKRTGGWCWCACPCPPSWPGRWR